MCTIVLRCHSLSSLCAVSANCLNPEKIRDTSVRETSKAPEGEDGGKDDAHEIDFGAYV